MVELPTAVWVMLRICQKAARRQVAELVRVVVVLNRRDQVLAAYSIEVADRQISDEDRCILAARRLARRDLPRLGAEQLQFVIAPLTA